MDRIERLKLLNSNMDLEHDGVSDRSCRSTNKQDLSISRAILPNGKSMRLLKTLLTSACENNCFYCPFRSGRNFRRATFKPEELANTYMDLHTAGITQGIFLSSAIVGGGTFTQDKLIDTAAILREKMGYKGYLHLKIMPGAEFYQVVRCMQLADRVSINLEAPNTERLKRLAPQKKFIKELFTPLRWVEKIRRSQPQHIGWNGRWPSSVTQFVVGGAGESDHELLESTQYLYETTRIKRAYYSPFRPFPETPLVNNPPENLQREHRLYQASFLLRDYGFKLDELIFDPKGRLHLHTDPKLTWANRNLREKPVEVNDASLEELMRIPGIGIISAKAIIKARKQNKFADISQIGKIGVIASKAAPFILLNGKNAPYQLHF